MKEKLVTLFSRADGNVVIVFALSILPVTAGVGAAVDYSRLASAKTSLQVLADAAALAGAKNLAETEGQPDGTRTAAAITRASQVVASRPIGAQGDYAPDLAAKQMRVALTSNQTLLFGRILGSGLGNIGSSATASYARALTPCFIALGSTEPVGIDMQGSPKITATRCTIESNVTGPNAIQMKGASKIVAERVCAVGDASSFASKTQPVATGGCSPAPDPFSTVLPAQLGGCDHTGLSFGSSTKTATLQPGIYCGGLSFGGTDVTLSPGIYEFRDGPLSIQGSGSLSGSGVALVLRGTGATLQLQGNPQVNLSAMSSGPLSGLVISAVPSSPVQTSTLQGSPNVTLRGSLYLPGQRLELHGSPALTTTGTTDRVVALSYDLQGSPDVVLQSDSSVLANGDVSLRILH